MPLHLTSADLARCETVSRALLSPLAVSTVDEWRAEVLRSIRELLHADHALFMLSSAEKVHFSDSLDATAVRGYDQYLAGADDSGVRLTDPVIERWLAVRQAAGLEVFTNAESDHLLKPYGLSLSQSPMYQDGLAAAGVIDQRSMFVTFSSGVSLIQCGLLRTNGDRLGSGALDLLRVLLPSFRAGVEAISRFSGRCAVLDALSQPVAIFGDAGQELHRNPALVRLLETESERERLGAGIARIASLLNPLSMGRATTRAAEALSGSEHSVTTGRAQYHLRGTILGPGAFADHPVLMVFVERHGARALPAPEVLRERYGLTKREAEVALLLAEGRTNAEIAEQLYLSLHTIRRHAESVLAKVGVNTRKALGLRFIEE